MCITPLDSNDFFLMLWCMSRTIHPGRVNATRPITNGCSGENGVGVNAFGPRAISQAWSTWHKDSGRSSTLRSIRKSRIGQFFKIHQPVSHMKAGCITNGRVPEGGGRSVFEYCYQLFSATNTSSSIFLASPKSMRLFSL